MALFSGAIRFRRYQVTGTLPKELRSAFEARIQKFAFTEFAGEDARDEAVGWVNPDDWFDTALTPDQWLVDDLIVLTLRTDVRKVPSLILRNECRKVEEERKARDNRDRLTRVERDEIKDTMLRVLSARVLPTCRGADFAWDVKREEVLFFSSGEGANETFRTIFEKTFEVKLRPLFPYAQAIRGLETSEAVKLDAVTPARFAERGVA